MRALTRKIVRALLNRWVPRTYILDRTSGDIALLSQVTAHLMNARAELLNAVSVSIASAMPIVMPESPGHIKLNNGYILTIKFSDTPEFIEVRVGTRGTDYAFEWAVWEMLRTSPFFHGYDGPYGNAMGLNHCKIVGVDKAIMDQHAGVMKQAGHIALNKNS